MLPAPAGKRIVLSRLGVAPSDHNRTVLSSEPVTANRAGPINIRALYGSRVHAGIDDQHGLIVERGPLRWFVLRCGYRYEAEQNRTGHCRCNAHAWNELRKSRCGA